MKNLIKKVLRPLTPLVLLGSLVIPNLQPFTAKASEFNISGGVGGFNLEEDPQEIYGRFPRFKVGMVYSPEEIDQNITGRIEGGVDVICRFNKITIQPRIVYSFNEKDKISPYVGLAIPYVFATEEATATASYYEGVESVTVKGKLRGIGIGGVIGIDAPITKNLSFYAKGSYSKVNVELQEMEINNEAWEVEAEEKVNVGGLALDVGVKVRF